MMNTLDFFATPGPMTQPEGYAHLFDPLPHDVAALCQIIQGLTLHIYWARHYGLSPDEVRSEETQLRYVTQKLARIMELDPRPLTEARPPAQRLVCNCRDMSLLLTAILRYQGVPARARCGFARYFAPNHYEDHWVVEYWHGAQQRWVFVDAQLDSLIGHKLSLQFDPLDVPRDQFIVAGRAWQLCRQGLADPDTFGILEWHGLWFVQGNLVRDVAALNKVELLPWDSWGLMVEDPHAPIDELFLDSVAESVQADVPEFDRVRQLYTHDDRFRVPKTIHSHTPTGLQQVELSLY